MLIIKKYPRNTWMKWLKQKRSLVGGERDFSLLVGRQKIKMLLGESAKYTDRCSFHFSSGFRKTLLAYLTLTYSWKMTLF